MSFSEAFEKIKDAGHLCMISDSLLLAIRYNAKLRYFLAAYPAKRAWYQFAPCVDQFEAADWRVIGFPVGWENGADASTKNPFVSDGSLEDMRRGRA